MMRISITAIIFAIFASTLTPSEAIENCTLAIKDSTIIHYGWPQPCSFCPKGLCEYCPYGKKPNLALYNNIGVKIRALVGFILPGGTLTLSSEITACSIQFPPFTEPSQRESKIHVYLANSSDWNEDTVSAGTAPGTEEPPLVEIDVPANASLGPIDVTPACKKAQRSTDGQFSIILATDGDHYEMGSKESGNPAILCVTYQ